MISPLSFNIYGMSCTSRSALESLHTLTVGVCKNVLLVKLNNCLGFFFLQQCSMPVNTDEESMERSIVNMISLIQTTQVVRKHECKSTFSSFPNDWEETYYLFSSRFVRSYMLYNIFRSLLLPYIFLILFEL